MENKMFCFQCQETACGKGCTICGVCGKKPEVAAMQDLLVYTLKGLSAVTTRLRQEGKTVSADINHLVTMNLFMTITNANFDCAAIICAIHKTLKIKCELLSQLADKANLPEAALWDGDEAEFDVKAATVGVLATVNEDIRSLRELVIYGLKGLAAYLKHANALMQDNAGIDAFIQSALSKTLDDTLDANALTALVLETGKYGVDGMALLDKANTTAYGNPEITEVELGVRGNPGILVSGHDLRDLEMLLEQSAGQGIDIYTHSEMLPAHYYPAFKKYPHFAGNYGNAWWKQKEEFEAFNGPILMTTNCVVPPLESYRARLWTTGAAGFSGCKHIPGEYGEIKDFSGIIAQAKTCQPPKQLETGKIVGGFAHEQVFPEHGGGCIKKEGFALLVHVLDVVEVAGCTSAATDDDVFKFGDFMEHFALNFAEGSFAAFTKDVGDSLMETVFYVPIEVVEVEFHFAGKHFPNGGLACSHVAEKDDANHKIKL